MSSKIGVLPIFELSSKRAQRREKSRYLSFELKEGESPDI
jgi:hypothetical protein